LSLSSFLFLLLVFLPCFFSFSVFFFFFSLSKYILCSFPPRSAPGEIDPRLEHPPAHAQVRVVLTETAERERRIVPEAGFDVASDDEPADTPEAEVGHHRRVGPEPDPKERARAPRGPEGEKRPSTGAHDPSVDAHRHPGRRGGKKSENAPRAAEPRQETDRKPRPETPRTRMRTGRFLATKDRPGKFGRPGPDEGADEGGPGGRERRSFRPRNRGERGRARGRRRDRDGERERKDDRPDGDRGEDLAPIRPSPHDPQTSSRMRMALPARPRR
jgi:hypothetical protein